MIAQRRILCGLVMLGIAIALSISTVRLASAGRDRDAAELRLQQVHDDARTIMSLRRQSEQVSVDARPTEDVLALVHAALAEAGLPQHHLADLRNESDAALPSPGGDGPQYRKQSLSVSLRELSPADLGAFLIAWRRLPGVQIPGVWSVTRLTLTHPRGRNQSSGLYDVNLVISAIYLEESPRVSQ